MFIKHQFDKIVIYITKFDEVLVSSIMYFDFNTFKNKSTAIDDIHS
jgi:hypothetical protein